MVLSVFHYNKMALIAKIVLQHLKCFTSLLNIDVWGLILFLKEIIYGSKVSQNDINLHVLMLI